MKTEMTRQGAAASRKHQRCVDQDAASSMRSADHLYRGGGCHISLRCPTMLLMVAVVTLSMPVQCENLGTTSISPTITESLHLIQTPVKQNEDASNTSNNTKHSNSIVTQFNESEKDESSSADNAEEIENNTNDSESLMLSNSDSSSQASNGNSSIENNTDDSGSLMLSNSDGSNQASNGNSSIEQDSKYSESNESNCHNWYEDLISQNSNETSQDFNSTLILEILRNLNNSRDSRLYLPHMMSHGGGYRTSRRGDQYGEVPVNVQPMSLWDYFSSFIFNEESQTPQERQNLPQQSIVVNRKSVSNPCDNIQGNIDYWKLNARPLSVTVVGGGIAGLASLKTLIKLGFKDAILLEAQQRLGGGVNTIRHERWLVEEGPSKIRGGGKNPMYLIAKELEEVMDHPPSHRWEKVAVDNDGNVLTEGAVIKGFKVIGDILKEVKSGGLLNYVGQAVGKFYVNRFKAIWGTVLDQNFMHAWIYYLHQMICGRDGLSGWFKASARDANAFKHMEPDYYWKTGADQAVHYLLRGIPSENVHLSSPVCRVFWDVNENNEVLVVTADGSSYRSGALVMTIPPSVLKGSHRMMFIPSLPKEASDAFESVETGISNKIFLGWNSPWWGSDKPLDLHVFWKDFNFPTQMDWVMSIVRVTSTPQRPNMVEMIVTDDASLTMEELSPEQIIGHLIYFLKRVSKREDIPLPAFFHRSKWNSNPWTRGSYGSYVTLDGETKRGIRNRRSLAPKITNSRGRQSLFFAGEYTSNDRYGTMDGAMMSGVRAAHWVVQEDKQRRELANLYKVTPSHRQKITSQNTPDFYKEVANYYDFFKDPQNFLGDRSRTGMTRGQVSKDSSIEQKYESKNIRKLLRQRKKQEKQKQQYQISHKDSVEVNEPSLHITGPVISRNPPPFVFTDTSSSEDQDNLSLSNSKELKGNKKNQGKRRKKKKNKNESIFGDAETNVQLTLPISKLIPALFTEQIQNSEETEDIISTTSVSTTTISTTLITQPTEQTTMTTPAPQHPPKQLTPIPIDPSGTHVTSIPNNGNYPQHPPRPITPKPIQHPTPHSVSPHLQHTAHANPPTNHHSPLQQTHQSHNHYSTKIDTQPYITNNAASSFTSQNSQISVQPHVHSPHNIGIQGQSRPLHQTQHFTTNANNNQGVMNSHNPSVIQHKIQNTQNLSHKYDIHSPSDPSNIQPIVQSQHMPQSSSPSDPSNIRPVVQSQHMPQSSPINLFSQHKPQPLHNYQLRPAPKPQPHIQLNQGQELNHPQQIQVQHSSEYQGNLNFNRIKSQGAQSFPNQHPISHSSSTHYYPGFQPPKTHLINTGNIPSNGPQQQGQMSPTIADAHESKRFSQEIYQSKNSNEQNSNRNRRKNNRKRNHNKKQQSFTSLENTRISNRRKNRNKNDRNNKRTNNEELNQEEITHIRRGSKNSQENENNYNRRRNKNRNRKNNKPLRHKKQDNGSNNDKRNQPSNKSNISSQQKSTLNSKEPLSKEISQSTLEDKSQPSTPRPPMSGTSSVKHMMLPQVIHISGPVYTNHGVPTHLRLLNNSAVNTSTGSSNPLSQVHDNSKENTNLNNSSALTTKYVEKDQKPTQAFSEVEQKFVSTLTTRTRPFNFNLNDKELLHLLTFDGNSKREDTNEPSVESKLAQLRNYYKLKEQSEYPSISGLPDSSNLKSQQSQHVSEGQGNLNIKNNYPDPEFMIGSEVYKSQPNMRNPPRLSLIVRPDMPFSPLHFNENYRPNNKILGGSRIHSMRPQYQTPDSFTNSHELNISNKSEQPADSPT